MHRFTTPRALGHFLIFVLAVTPILVPGILAPRWAVAASGNDGNFELGGDAARARAVYDQYCAACHGPQGKGDGPMGEYLVPQPKDLTNAEYMETRSDEQLYVAIRDGGAEVGLSDKMAPWKHLLTDQQIRDLAAYVRTLSEGSE